MDVYNGDNDDEDQEAKDSNSGALILEPDSKRFLWKIRLRYWYTSFMIVIIVLALVMIGSISTPRWAEQGSGGKKWRTGLLKCGGCQGRWANTYITEIVKEAEDNNVNGYSETFQKLRSGGYFYVLFESFALLTIFVWIAIIIGMMLRKPLFRDKFVKLTMLLTISFHSIAIIGWFGFTQAAFNNKCDEISDYENSYDVCPTHGPAMAIFIELFLFLIQFLFFLVFINRENSIDLRIR